LGGAVRGAKWPVAAIQVVVRLLRPFLRHAGGTPMGLERGRAAGAEPGAGGSGIEPVQGNSALSGGRPQATLEQVVPVGGIRLCGIVGSGTEPGQECPP